MLCACASCPLDPVLGKDRLNFVPQRLFDDCRMFSRIGMILMRNLAAVNSIPQHQIECAAGEFMAAVRGAIRAGSSLAPDPGLCKFVL